MSMMSDDNVKRLPGAKRAQGICFAISFANALLIIGQTVALAWVLSNLWYGAEIGGQVVGILAFVACWCARVLFTHVRARFIDRFARTSANDLRTRALESIYDTGPVALQQRGSASMLTSLLEGIDQIRTYISLTLSKTADLMVYTALFALALLWFDLISGIIVIAVVPCTIFFMRLLGNYTKENAGKQFAAYRRLANRFADSLRGMSVLVAFGAEEAQAQTVYDSSEKLRQHTIATLKTATLNSLVLDLFRVFALAAVAIMLGFRLMAGNAELFPALAVLILTPELFGALRRWANDFHASLDGRNQLAAVLDIIEQVPPSVQEAYSFEEGAAPELAFDNVSFRYATEDETRLHLDSLSFSVQGPCRIGIVGASGAGKTTLAQLIAGFASPCSGEVRVNGTAGSTLACESWRSHVAYLPQSPHLFNSTLRENIAFYRPDASDDEIKAAAKSAGLDELLRELPDGLETVLGEGGRAISGGQAQRVALARVFLDNARDVVVFDEPTAHLDIETELALKQNMLDLMDGRLVFFATHRMHWMRDMDLVIVLEDGRIAQIGSYDDLASKPGAFTLLARELRGDVA